MKNSQYDQALRSLGYVDSGLSGSRGDFFILSYKPGAKKRHKLYEGLVEVHVCNRFFQVITPVGKFKTLKDAIQRLQ